MNVSPWGSRRRLIVSGRQRSRVTVQVEVYRQKVWLTTIDIPFVTEAILEPGQAVNVAELLVQSAREAQGKQTAKTQKTVETQEGIEEEEERNEAEWGLTTDSTDVSEVEP